MKALVVYSSQTGNTRKLADALYGALQCEKVIMPLSDNPDPADYDFIAVGFWLKGGEPESATKEFLSKIGKKEVFLFATHGSAKDSAHAQNAMKKAKDLLAEARVVGTYSCQGEVAQDVMEAAAAKDPQPPWFADAATAKGHPDDEDVRQLVHLFNELSLP
jgi:flavodoxin